MRPLTLVLSAGIVFLSTGCLKSPRSAIYRLDLPIPAGWQERAAQKPVADTNWIASFRDSRLSKLVDEALSENKDLKVTASRIKVAEASAVIAGADLTPNIRGEFDGSRSARNFIGFPFGGSGPGVVQSSLSNNFGISLNTSWEIDIWGRIRSAKKAAIADLQASEADYMAARLSIAGQTAKVWFALIAAQEQVDVAKRALEIFKQTEETIRRQFEGGVQDQGGQDVAAQLQLSMADIENARATLKMREEQLMRLRKQLEVVLGRYPAGALISGARLPSVPATPPSGLPSDLLDRRPDLLAAERRLAAADKRVLSAKRSLLPAFSLTASYGTSTPDLEEVLNSTFSVWNLAGGVTQPILDGRRLRQTVKLRQADEEGALADYQSVALVAFREVEEALAADRFLAERQFSLQKAVDHNQSAYDRARQDYAGGVGDVLTMLRGQQQLIQSESSLIDAKRERLENRIDLHQALGGGFRAQE